MQNTHALVVQNDFIKNLTKSAIKQGNEISKLKKIVTVRNRY